MRRNMSLQQLADAVGASKAHIYELETNRSNNPSLSLLTALSQKLDVPIKVLIGESDEIAGDEEQKLAPLFRDLRGLSKESLELIQSLTDKLREQSKDGDKDKPKD